MASASAGLLLLGSWCPPAHAEEAAEAPVEPAASKAATLGPMVELSGMVGGFVGPSTLGMTFGGPKVGARLGELTLGLSFYPSLVYSERWDEPALRPTLGFGPELGIRGVTLFYPVYVIGDRITPAVGLGYRFGL